MNTRVSPLIAAALSAALMTATGAALAGPKMKEGGCHGKEGRHALHQRDDGARHERMQQRLAERQAQLKSALQLTPAQESAWQAYAAALQMPAPPHQRPGSGEPLTTLERMERHLAHQQERQQALTQRLQATRQLYDSLTPAQRETFDRFHQRRGHAPMPPTNG